MAAALLTNTLLAGWSFAYRIYRTLVNLVSRQDHFAPHPESGFEGYYSRVQLEDGATLAVIFCWVKKAKERPHYVHVSYTPPLRQVKTGSNEGGIAEFKYDFFPDALTINVQPKLPNGQRPFSAHMPGFGTMSVNAHAVEYIISRPDLQLQLDLKLTNRVPWSRNDPLSGPMGFIHRLSSIIPLNWLVYSTASSASLRLSHAGETLSGSGLAHTEKNWGVSFPAAWIWSQSFPTGGGDNTASLSVAGGVTLPGVQAYLVGYRSPKLQWDFRPPFALAIGPLSPFMHVKQDSKLGTVDLSVSTLTRKLTVKVSAPPETFMDLAAPLGDGHRPMFAFESFEGQTRVEAWIRRWPWQSWRLVEAGECGLAQNGIPCSALEFGGAYSHQVCGIGTKRK